ncbi:unnamed protein product [Caenorhabditis brenneri]
MVVVKAAHKSLNSYSLSNTGIESLQQLVEFCKDGDGLVQIKYYMQLPNNEESMKRAIIDNVTALFFRKSPTVQLKVRVDDGLGELVPIPGVVSTKLGGNQVDVTFLEELFAKYPNQKSASIASLLTGELSSDSKLFELQDLWCKNVSRLALPIAKRFDGRNLILLNADLDPVEELTSIVRKWISNEAYHNLKVMHIRSKSRIDRRRLGIRQVAQTRWLLEPYMFEYESINKESFIGPMSIDCRRYYQIERESDHKIAAFRVINRSFEFFVWNRTRDQFVEMQQMSPKKRAYEEEMQKIQQKDDLNLSDEQVREYEQLKDQANRQSAMVKRSLLKARQVFENDQSALKHELRKQSDKQARIEVKEKDLQRIQRQIAELQGKIQKTEAVEKALREKLKEIEAADLRAKSKKCDEKVVKKLREKRDSLYKKFNIPKRRKVNEVESVRSKLTYRTNRLTYFKKELISLQRSILQRVQNELEGLTSELEHIAAKITQCQERLRESEAEVRALETRSNEVADRIFADFCQRIGIASIRDYENREMRIRQEMKDKLRSFDDDPSKKSRNHSSDDSDNIPIRARRRVRRFSPQPSNPKDQEHLQRKRQRKIVNEKSQESSEQSENRAPDNSSKRVKNSSPARSMIKEDDAPDDSSREPSNPETQQLRQPKEEGAIEAPGTRSDQITQIKTDPEDGGYTSRMKFLETIQLFFLNLNMPIFTTLQARIEKKLRESTTDAEISNDEISSALELLLAKITSNSVSNPSENAESVRFSHFMCFLQAAIISSKLKGLENLLEKINAKIKEPIYKDKNIPAEKVATAVHSVLRAIGF